MPRGDGTGPMGMGPMTGRGAGFCVGSRMAGYANAGAGRGFGMGFGRGRGFGGGGCGRRNMFYATGLPGRMRFGAQKGPFQAQDVEFEKQALKNHAAVLQSEQEYIKKLLEELEKKTAKTAAE